MAPRVRVRFSPSPTGEFHLGTARTALFKACASVRELGGQALDALAAGLAGCRTMDIAQAEDVLKEARKAVPDSDSATAMHGIRAALTGRDSGPRLTDVLVVLGPEEARARLAAARSCAC